MGINIYKFYLIRGQYPKYIKKNSYNSIANHPIKN